jgi:2-oxoisovalerate dehydrogenase E1 component
VIFLESQRLYDIGELFQPDVPEGFYEIPIGLPALRRVGSDLTIVTIGPSLYAALEAADQLQTEYGVSAEVIDCRSISPIDYAPLVTSVKKTGRLVVVSEACERGSMPHTVASTLTQLAFDYLDGPPAVVGSRNWITPSADMEHTFFPQSSWIVDAIHERLVPLQGHQPATDQTTEALQRRARNGV